MSSWAGSALLSVDSAEAADIRRRFAQLVGDALPADPAALTERWARLHERWCGPEAPPAVWGSAPTQPVWSSPGAPSEPLSAEYASEPPPFGPSEVVLSLSLGCQTSPIRPDLLALHWDAPDVTCDDGPTPIPSPPASPRHRPAPLRPLPLPPRYLPLLVGRSRAVPSEPGLAGWRKRAGARLVAQPPAFGVPPAGLEAPAKPPGGRDCVADAEAWLDEAELWAPEEQLLGLEPPELPPST